jgi:hypothetical protein
MDTWPKNIRNSTAPAHTRRALRSARSSGGWSAKITSVSRLGYARARHWHFLFPVPNCRAEFFYVSPLLPVLFLPRSPRLQAASSRRISHMQAG